MSTSKRRRDQHPLVQQQLRQIVFREEPVHQQLQQLFAVTWLPGDRTGRFIGKLFRPLGSAVLCLLRYETIQRPLPGEVVESPFRRMPFAGFTAAAEPTGSVAYEENRFSYDARNRMHARATGQSMDPHRNPVLAQTALDLDRAAFRKLQSRHTLPVIPRFPKVWLGFVAGSLPPFEDSPALQAEVARRLQIPVAHLGSKDPALLDMMLRQTWAESILPPGVDGNTTEHTLVDAELCSHGRAALRVYEDFRELAGVGVFNVARTVLAGSRPNPAARVLQAFGIDTRQPDWQEQAIPEELLDKLEAGMRRAIGVGHETFDQEALYAGLAHPDAPLHNGLGSYQQALEKMGEERAVQACRTLLSDAENACCTVVDLQTALRNPDRPLILSGACSIQVVHKQPLPDDQCFTFEPVVLGRKVRADLYRHLAVPPVRVPAASREAHQVAGEGEGDELSFPPVPVETVDELEFRRSRGKRSRLAGRMPMPWPLQPPDDELPESWLHQRDRQPTLLPVWPASNRMAIVVCVVPGYGRMPAGSNESLPESQAFVLLSRDELRQAADRELLHNRLFFSVPRTVLLDGIVCPGLTQAAFRD